MGLIIKFYKKYSYSALVNVYKAIIIFLKLVKKFNNYKNYLKVLRKIIKKRD